MGSPRRAKAKTSKAMNLEPEKLIALSTSRAALQMTTGSLAVRSPQHSPCRSPQRTPCRSPLSSPPRKRKANQVLEVSLAKARLLDGPPTLHLSASSQEGKEGRENYRESFLQVAESLQDGGLPWNELKRVMDNLPHDLLTQSDKDQHTLLHFAAKACINSLKLVKYIESLWQAGSFRASTPLRVDALLGAALQGNADVCQYIINSKIDVNAAGPHQQTALFYAVRVHGSKRALKIELCDRSLQTATQLIKLRADVEHKDVNQQTPLFSAADCDRSSDFVDILLKKNANPNHLDSGMRTPLFSAARAGNVETILRLATAKADIHHIDSCQHNALRYAVKASRGPAALVLLQELFAGVPPTDKTGTVDEHGDGSCLAMAEERGLTAVRDQLLFVSACAAAVRGGTERQLSKSLSSHPECVLPNPSKSTFLHEAAARTDSEGALLCKLLIQRLDINAQDRCGKTPLFRAVISGNLATVELLLESRADANIQEHLPAHTTCLFYAVRDGSEKLANSNSSIVQALMRAMDRSVIAETYDKCRRDHLRETAPQAVKTETLSQASTEKNESPSLASSPNA